jgi:uncharacterized cofD-like protein
VLRGWRTWLRPGMGIKRWIALILVGSALTGLALAMALVYGYRYYPFPPALVGFVQTVTLQFLPRELRFALVLSIGLACVAVGVRQLGRSLLDPVLARAGDGRDLAAIVAEHRFGPPTPATIVVAVGGGTGLSSLLRGLKHQDVAITAVVTVADDGGSTGRIRSEFDIPAPGDIRNCLAALADDEALVSRLFQYRFDQGGAGLHGHSFGNLFITALAQVTGSFERAVIESASVLNIRGRVLPSTVANVHLNAELQNGVVMRGESSIERKTAPIARVFLEPDHPPVYEPAFGAILNADLVVLGPGSLYTSVVPNLLVEGIAQAVRWSPATVVYVCNVATQPGETDGFSAADHVRVLLDLLGPGVIDVVLVNSNPASGRAVAAADEPIDPVLPDSLAGFGGAFRVVARDVVSDRNPLRHDPEKLTAALLEIAREAAAARVARRG